jgi:integrase/recombinase XerD
MALPYWVEFFDDLQNVRGRSTNTVLAYRRDLELYEEFSDSKKDLAQFPEFMRKRQLSLRSQARVISSLRTYFRFLSKRGEKTPELRELRPPRIKPHLPKPLSFDDFQKLYSACETENVHRTARNQVTLLMLFGLGCRVSELVALDLQNFHSSDGWLKVIGKGGKERLIPLSDRLLKELRDYLKEIRPHLVKDGSNSILINDRGRRPSRVDIWRWLAAWSAKAGFEEPVGPHQFRHGCATALLEGGADLRTIQMLLGHSSIQTTQIYTTVTTNRLQSEIDLHHPLSGFKTIEEI